ncbi:hypothetical protein HALLA_18045 [Halostagnicola larsenii XH-48]|uniref:Rhodopsin n=1 Tax=Halostagnicola larsenii XH-48 TaxID=797299 RepID=W0JUW5_9EURY|nr:bacteriorhodopsin [Halostagnicola larsenii]AHG01147.1 hypothetical protein HALLA_18045 [Halostagnicola larsenii XH-48]
MISELVLYRWFGLALVVGSLVIAGASQKLPKDVRKYGYLPAIAAAGMGVSYVLMSLEFLMIEVEPGVETSGARFIGYTILWLAFAYVLQRSSGVSYRSIGILVAALLWANWSTLGGWMAGGILRLAIMVSMVCMIGVTIYLLTSPFRRSADRKHPERRLLYVKIMYLTILTWVAMLLSGILAEYNLGVTDTFVGASIAIYADTVLILGFTVILFGGREALARIGAVSDGSETGSQPTAGARETVRS